MGRGYMASPLLQHEVDRALPLATALAPGLGLNEWRDFCAEIPEPDESNPPRILVLRDGDVLRGLCIFDPRWHRVARRVLDIPAVVVCSIGDAAGLTEELVDSLKQICSELSLEEISLIMPIEEGQTLDLLARHGARRVGLSITLDAFSR